MKYFVFLIMLLTVFGIYKIFSSSKTDNRMDNLFSQNPVIPDVRSVSEFETGHINGTINIPLNSIETISLAGFDQRRPVITYCSHGVRSILAVQVLKSRGLKMYTMAEYGRIWPAVWKPKINKHQNS